MVVMLRFFYMYTSVIKGRYSGLVAKNTPVVLACTPHDIGMCTSAKRGVIFERRCLHPDPRRFPFSGICAVFVLLWWVYLKYRTYTAPK